MVLISSLVVYENSDTPFLLNPAKESLDEDSLSHFSTIQLDTAYCDGFMQQTFSLQIVSSL